MIKYTLKCAACTHEFEGWFPDSAGYEKQARQGVIACPVCDSTDVGKAIMAPNIAVRSNRSTGPEGSLTREQAKAQIRQILSEIRKDVEDNCDYVGKEFPTEARKIHYGEAEERGIYGEATADEAAELEEEGIDVMPLPWPNREDA